ncbi:MAG: hydroxyacylglutathione hydrolase [Idiomarina sp.]|nr:hydroxyacylglutathione hydrolase [Idiomarina sp.]
MHIHAVSAFDDNYIWIIHDSHHCVVIDPGQAEGVIEFVSQHQLSIAAILVTHHHHDHTGGVKALRQLTDCPVYGPDNPTISELTHRVGDADNVNIPSLGLDFSVLACPGHTLDHIAFYAAPWLFCGDTLFSAGCGRMFEGQPQQFWHSLEYLSALPDDTLVYCAHEYTEANLNFAAAVEPDNHAITTYLAEVKKKREDGQITLPSTLALEFNVNPFLRCRMQSVKDAAQQRAQTSLTDPADVFACIRHWKDSF